MRSTRYRTGLRHLRAPLTPLLGGVASSFRLASRPHPSIWRRRPYLARPHLCAQGSFTDGMECCRCSMHERPFMCEYKLLFTIFHPSLCDAKSVGSVWKTIDIATRILASSSVTINVGAFPPIAQIKVLKNQT
jgi:hypothetical protein